MRIPARLLPIAIAWAILVLLNACASSAEAPTLATEDPAAVPSSSAPTEAVAAAADTTGPGADQPGSEPEPSPAESDPAGADDGQSDASDVKLALTETFTNTVFGYAIDYPTGWFVSDAGQTVMISSFDPMRGAGSGGVPSDQTKIDILALEGFPLDLEARVAQIESEAASAGASVEQESIALAGGEPAVWLGLTGGMVGNSGVVVTILDGELYQLQAYGNPMPLPAIARTLRAAPKVAPE